MAELERLLIHLKEQGGSDLHLPAGLEPRFRVKGRMRVIDGEPVLDDAALRALMQEIASPRAWHEYALTNDLDFAYGLEGVAREGRIGPVNWRIA